MYFYRRNFGKIRLLIIGFVVGSFFILGRRFSSNFAIKWETYQDEERKSLAERKKKIPAKTAKMETKVEIKAEAEVEAETASERRLETKETSPIKPDKDEPRADENKEIPYREIFEDDLFLGDSITDSLAFYNLLDKENVIAELGFTVRNAKEEIENIKSSSPENIYILFGNNDISYYKRSEIFIIPYRELIDRIQTELPDSKIYIQSILPVGPDVEDEEPLFSQENIGDFNKALKDLAREEELDYLNIREIVEENMDLLEPDEIHMKYQFYELWLDYLQEKTK